MIPGITLIDTLSRPRGPVQVTQTAVTSSVANQSVYTFNSQSLGPEPDFNQERIIVLGTGGFTNNSGATSTTATVGGVSAVKIAVAAAGFDTVSLWVVQIQAGTTADVVVTFSNTMERAYCVTYRMQGADGLAPSNAVTDSLLSGNDLNSIVNCPADGAIVGISSIRRSSSASVATTAWTNLTEDTDNVVESNESNFSSAHDEFSTQQTGRSITATSSGAGVSVAGRLALASWGPA